MAASAHSPRHAADSRLNALLDAAVDAMVLISANGLITRFNPAAERIFGYAESEVLGRNVSVLMPEPYHGEHDSYMQRYQRTGEQRIIGIGREVVARRKDGGTFPIDLSVGEFQNGEESGFVGILRDISERKRQESQLRQQADELRLIFENAPTPILITAMTGLILQANRACCALLGFDSGDLQQKRQSDLLHADDRDTAVQHLQQFGSGGATSCRCELRYLRSDGSVLHTVTYAALSADEGGPAPLVICEIVDRTALLSAEREADELRGRLAHVGRLGTLGEMVSGIAHEVNQPLTAIANYASASRRLLASGQAQPAELAGTLEKISQQAERAGQVIRGLRSLVRRKDAVREPLDCNQLVREVVRLTEFELRQSDFRLVSRLAPELPRVMGDGIQIQQVLLNLIRNGYDAMKEQPSGDFIEVTSGSDGEWIEIRIADCGPGIDAKVAERLFEPFFTSKPLGIGLGLSICKSIMSAHNGSLSFSANQWGGASFLMRLPAFTEQEPV